MSSEQKSQPQALPGTQPLDLLEQALNVGFERLGRSPAFLNAVSMALNLDSKARIGVKRTLEGIWSALELPVRKEQEREMQLLSQLEERVRVLETELRKARRGAH